MKISPWRVLDPGEQKWCLAMLQTESTVEATRVAYPDWAVDKTARQVYERGKRISNKRKIQDALRFAMNDPLEISQAIMRDRLLLGNEDEQFKAAQNITQRNISESQKSAIERWVETIRQLGVEVVKPVPPTGVEEVTVSFDDLITGGAFLHYPLAAKTELLKRAGAPWNEQQSDASLSPLQIELLSRQERVLIVHGGSGVGKSVLGACFALIELTKPNARIAIIAATYDHAGAEFQYIHEGFLRVFGRAAATRCQYENRMNHHDMEIETVWGATCRAYSTDRQFGANILGKEFDLVVLGEGSNIAPDIYERKILRAIDRRAKVQRWCEELGCLVPNCDLPEHQYIRQTGRSVIFTTPLGYDGCSGSEWERVQRETDNKPEKYQFGNIPWHRSIYLREAAVVENPSYSREVFENRRKTLGTDAFEEQYLGKMTRRSGLVIPEYDRTRHRLAIPDPMTVRRMRLAVGIDTGKHFAAVLAGMERDRKKWILGEVYTKECSISENSDEVKDMVIEYLAKPFGVEVTPENREQVWEALRERVDLWYADPASQHKEDLQEHLDVPILYEKQELLGSLDTLRTFFKTDTLYLNEDLEWLHWELCRYTWKVVSGNKTPSKQMLMPRQMDDHLIDATRFALNPLEQMGPTEDEPAPVTFEQNWDAQVRYALVGRFKDEMAAREIDATNVGAAYRGIHG